MEVTLGETDIDVEQSWSSSTIYRFDFPISTDFASKNRRFSHILR